MLNLEAHAGLRGAASLWVMLFHCVYYSEFQMNFQGSSLMPLFFLLSGFSLTIRYGTSNYSPLRPSFHEHSEISNALFEAGIFYRNRFARVMPTYYASLILALPLWFLGFGGSPSSQYEAIVSSTIVSVFPLCTLFCFALGSCINGPGWTVCTLVVQWSMFPYFLPRIQKLSDHQLVQYIALCYWLQLFLLLIVFFILLIIGLGFWIPFAAATMNPITRLPLFLMGMYAGELCSRHAEDSLPWPTMFSRFFPSCCCVRGSNIRTSNATVFNPTVQVNSEDMAPTTDVLDSGYWASKATSQSINLLLNTLIVCGMDTMNRYMNGGDGILGAVWFQAIVPFAQLELIVALTRDNGTSLAYRTLCTTVGRWLGERSMCIYLVHYPLIFYVSLAAYGKAVRWPDEFDCSKYDSSSADRQHCVDELNKFSDARAMPLWGIAVVPVAAILLADIFYRFIEQPCRKMLRV